VEIKGPCANVRGSLAVVYGSFRALLRMYMALFRERALHCRVGGALVVDVYGSFAGI